MSTQIFLPNEKARSAFSAFGFSGEGSQLTVADVVFQVTERKSIGPNPFEVFVAETRQSGRSVPRATLSLLKHLGLEGLRPEDEWQYVAGQNQLFGPFHLQKLLQWRKLEAMQPVMIRSIRTGLWMPFELLVKCFDSIRESQQQLSKMKPAVPEVPKTVPEMKAPPLYPVATPEGGEARVTETRGAALSITAVAAVGGNAVRAPLPTTATARTPAEILPPPVTSAVGSVMPQTGGNGSSVPLASPIRVMPPSVGIRPSLPHAMIPSAWRPPPVAPPPAPLALPVASESPVAVPRPQDGRSGGHSFVVRPLELKNAANGVSPVSVSRPDVVPLSAVGTALPLVRTASPVVAPALTSAPSPYQGVSASGPSIKKPVRLDMQTVLPPSLQGLPRPLQSSVPVKTSASPSTPSLPAVASHPSQQVPPPAFPQSSGHDRGSTRGSEVAVPAVSSQLSPQIPLNLPLSSSSPSPAMTPAEATLPAVPALSCVQLPQPRAAATGNRDPVGVAVPGLAAKSTFQTASLPIPTPKLMPQLGPPAQLPVQQPEPLVPPPEPRSEARVVESVTSKDDGKKGPFVEGPHAFPSVPPGVELPAQPWPHPASFESEVLIPAQSTPPSTDEPSQAGRGVARLLPEPVVVPRGKEHSARPAVSRRPERFSDSASRRSTAPHRVHNGAPTSGYGSIRGRPSNGWGDRHPTMNKIPGPIGGFGRRSSNADHPVLEPSLDPRVKDLLSLLYSAPSRGDPQTWSNLLSDTLECLKTGFTALIEYSMMETFGVLWTQAIRIQPPWEGKDIVPLLDGHKDMVLRQHMRREAQGRVEFLKRHIKRDLFSNPPTPESVLKFINLVKDVFETYNFSPIQDSPLSGRLRLENPTTFETATEQFRDGRSRISRLFDECLQAVQVLTGTCPQPGPRSPVDSRGRRSGRGQPAGRGYSVRGGRSAVPRGGGRQDFGGHGEPSRAVNPVPSNASGQVTAWGSGMGWIREKMGSVRATAANGYELLSFVKAMVNSMSRSGEELTAKLSSDSSMAHVLYQILEKIYNLLLALRTIQSKKEAGEAVDTTAAKDVLTAMKDVITLVRLDAFRYCRRLQMPDDRFVDEFKDKILSDQEEALSETVLFFDKNYRILHDISQQK